MHLCTRAEVPQGITVKKKRCNFASLKKKIAIGNKVANSNTPKNGSDNQAKQTKKKKEPAKPKLS